MSRPNPIRVRPRGAKIAEIHIAAKALGMDPSDKSPGSEYRTMLRNLVGVTSSTALTGAGLDVVVAHLRKLQAARGLQSTHAAKHAKRPKAPPADRQAQMGRIEAHLADAQRPWSYAHGMAQRMFKVDRLEFCNDDQLHRLVAALEYDQARRAKRPATAQDGPVGADQTREVA